MEKTNISWSSQGFLREYEPLMRMAKGGDQRAYSMVRELRTEEYRNTIEIVNQGGYTTEEGRRVVFPDLSRMGHETAFYRNAFSVKDEPMRAEPTRFEVHNVDCLDEGVRLTRAGYCPAVLNMASRSMPGGGVIKLNAMNLVDWRKIFNFVKSL